MSNTIKESIGAPSQGLGALLKGYSYSMELWEQCCSVIIFLNKISVERFKDFSYSLKGIMIYYP
jgi:hypothetical protein